MANNQTQYANPEMDLYLELKREINKLKQQIRFLNGQDLKDLSIGPDKWQSIMDSHFIIDSDKWVPDPIMEETCYFPSHKIHVFITLTFDPSRFGIGNDNHLEEQYLINMIYDSVEDQLIKPSIYGCFEKQQNGSIHAHFIAQLNVNKNELYRFYRRRLTDHHTNRVAVDIGQYRLMSSIMYINKEEPYKKYFKWSPFFGDQKSALDD